MLSRGELHDYWRAPGPDNQPRDYIDAPERSQFLIDLAAKHLPARASILELGCNVGRNLNALSSVGFDELTGIEINEEAVRLLRSFYPHLRWATIFAGSIEDQIGAFSTGAFDLVFTMAVLEHLHPESEWVFAEISRIGRMIVTIEDERSASQRHVPRDYGQVFADLGRTEIETRSCRDVPGLGPDFMARVFR